MFEFWIRFVEDSTIKIYNYLDENKTNIVFGVSAAEIIDSNNKIKISFDCAHIDFGTEDLDEYIVDCAKLDKYLDPPKIEPIKENLSIEI